ncbi:DUF1552 domain-containing protein [Pelagicoccus mobilis]|uniref:DUF1552 domain-containing protein n=1 Tax=Pelagicoccus mobilis TaxID=415221 RepID=A0A934RYB5_9BACT|nr:DUF1552 domain-containing protein [Pelagicoccus mobilis]MBK1878987.1 DUF1552 domain-containing protein [Pelagicoccus mobilis]
MTQQSSHSIAPSRRHFLKGIGACLALPAFHSLAAKNTVSTSGATALATTSSGAPLRTAFVFFPNGAIPKHWWPTGGGTDFELSRTLTPLEQHRESIQVHQGLDQINATPGKDGGGDHARGNSVFLTSVRIKKSATDIRAGISIDQAIAREIGHNTRFPSLELSCMTDKRTGACDTGYSCAYQNNLSWKSPTNPMTPESNPRTVFERLFGEGKHGERAANAQQRMMSRRSILDFVLSDAKNMQQRLDHRDREKLDQYLTGIREVEQRIQKLEQFGSPSDPKRPTPEGVPASFSQHIDIMYDMMLIAFQTDSTRVATFMTTHDGDNRPHDEIGISEGHHDLSHHQNKDEKIEKVARIDRWYVERFARFLTQMETTQDVDGNSLLHNSMIVYGSGNADGNRHTHDNLPLILAGQGGGKLNTGRFVKNGSQPLSNLYLDLADNMGASSLERFGDSTKRLGNT